MNIRCYKVLKIFLLAIILIPTISSAVLLDILQDILVIGQTLDQINRFNRAIVIECLKKIANSKDIEKNNYEEKENRSITNEQLFIFNNSLENLQEEKINWSKDTKGTKPPIENNQKFTFKDLAGSIPEDVKEIVDFLKYPEKYKRVGAKMPKGILLVGPPGTGKTSIARAIAGEANAAFFNTSATEFIELYVGVGPKAVRTLFQNARDAVRQGKNKKAIIFIDEIDAIGSSRQNEINSEYRNTLNELLNQMDGFKQDDSILVIAATNTPDSLDSALKRPGRFDRIVEIGLPDTDNRKEILKLYGKKITHDNSIDFEKMAVLTKGFSGAELENLVNEAAVRAARTNSKNVTMEHFEKAFNDIQTKNKYNRTR